MKNGAVKVVSGTSTILTKVALKNGTPTYTFTMPGPDNKGNDLSISLKSK